MAKTPKRAQPHTLRGCLCGTLCSKEALMLQSQGRRIGTLKYRSTFKGKTFSRKEPNTLLWSHVSVMWDGKNVVGVSDLQIKATSKGGFQAGKKQHLTKQGQMKWKRGEEKSSVEELSEPITWLDTAILWTHTARQHAESVACDLRQAAALKTQVTSCTTQETGDATMVTWSLHVKNESMCVLGGAWGG